jgi:mono/diheme cytochrome c family protein
MWVALSGCRDRDGDLPAAYRALAVPSQRLESPEARARGRRLFMEHCALCHGERGDGRGIRHEGFGRPPRDFTDSGWQRRTSPRHVYFAIREGVRGTAMPAWKVLDPDDTWDLVAYVRSLGRPRG